MTTKSVRHERLRPASAPKNVEMTVKLGRLLARKAYSSKFVCNKCSQTFRVTNTRCAVSLRSNGVAEDCMDFLRQRAAVPYGSTLKKNFHGRVGFANDNLSERWPPSAFRLVIHAVAGIQ